MKRRIGLAVALIVVLSTAFGFAIHFIGGTGTTGEPLGAELWSLRSTNGLYFQPALLAQHKSSIPDTVYDLEILSWAGKPSRSPWAAAGGIAAARDELAQSSVWGSWYLSQIEKLTGARSPIQVGPDLSRSYRSAGYFVDLPKPPTDTPSLLASTAAALEVVRQQNLPLAAGQREQIANWLEANVSSLANPYQACNLESALRLLDSPIPATVGQFLSNWWNQTGKNIIHLDSIEKVLDVYGYGCAAGIFGVSPGDSKEVLRQIIKPYLGRPGDEFSRYYLSYAWKELGGEASALTEMTSHASENLGPNGVAPQQVTNIGTVESSYYVAEIRRLSGISADDSQLVDAVREAGIQLRESGSSLTFAEIALIDRDSGGGSDSPDEQSSMNRLGHDLPATVTSQNFLSWSFAHDILGAGHGVAPPSTVESWDLNSREGRLRGWLVAAHRDAVTGPISNQLTTLVNEIPATLTRDDAVLNMLELHGAVQAWDAAAEDSPFPWDAIHFSLTELRGCQGFADLYRASRDSRECDLKSTMYGYWLENEVANHRS